MAARTNSSPSAPRHTARLGLEPLEAREVPAGFTGGFSNGLLVINGTAGDDAITLRQSGDVVTLDGYTSRWSASQITRIQINGGSGNDTITVSTSPQLAARLLADGGGGYDRLYTTAQPVGWHNFEVGQLISAPAAAPSGGVSVVRTGTTGPFTVSYYRRGDSAGELDGIYQTQAQADDAVARLQRWAAQINNGGSWDVVKITVEGESGPATPQPNTSGLAAFLSAAQQAASQALATLGGMTNQAVSLLDRLAAAYRQYQSYVRQIQQVRSRVQAIMNEWSQSIRDVQNGINQPFAALRNPTVLGVMATAIRNRANWARDEINRLLPGDVFASLRSALGQALNICYSAADRLDNLARAIRNSGGA